MRKLTTIMAAVMAIFAVASCGSSKQTGASLGQLEEKSPAQIYAEDAPDDVQRAWASYNDIDRTVAERGAAALARAELANQVGGIIESAVNIYRGKHMQTVSGEQKSQSVTDGGGEAGDEVKSAAEELIQGSRIVKSDSYIQRNGTRTAYVCVEVNIEMLIENAKNNQKLMKLISEQDKELIEQEKEEFQKEMRETFERYRKMRGRE